MATGYLTDVAYTAEFQEHLAPAWLAYIAAINGYAPPVLHKPFTWCELGCGKGITSLLLAATHPLGDFHACDFNPEHIEYAEALRAESDIRNLTLHARSFADMPEAALPAFDFICLHGVYSWVPEPVRAQIRTLIRQTLRPGGLVMVSYNAMPGWAHLQPIRHMMQAHTATVPGNSLDKARAAYGHVQWLASQGAGYFAAHPAAVRHLEEIATQDIRYVAHEYLTPHGDPFYFSEVEQAMRSIGLTFAGSMAAEDNYIESMAPPQFQKLLADAPTRAMLETQRDYVANTRFRRDLYCMQPAAPPVSELPIERLDAVAFCLVDVPERLASRQVSPGLRRDLAQEPDAVRAVYALLERGPSGARAISRAANLRGEGAITALIQKLVVARHLQPCSPVRAQSGWLKANAALIEAGIRERQIEVPLACPATGSASYCELVYASAIEAAARCGNAADAAEAVLQRLRRHSHPVSRHSATGEKRPATDAEVREYVTATWRSLSDRNNPDAKLLRLLGILA